MQDVMVSLKQVCKQFGQNQVVKNMDLGVHRGEFLTLLGPSGCGKTTTLRMIAGFESVSSGEITIQGESVAHKEPYERDVNTVFQNYALFPHMSVFQNVAYGLMIQKKKKEEIKKRVAEMLALVQLTGYEERKPDALSGGQRQRVAIARALINNPSVLLLDEPLGALDLKLRKQMQIELKRLQKKLGITFIYVTHDQEEALTMSDRIAVMNEGVIEQLAAPREIYECPKTKFVAQFIGETNLFEGKVIDRKEDKMTIEMEQGQVIAKAGQVQVGQQLYLSVRPEHIQLSKVAVPEFTIQGKVKDFIYTGVFMLTSVALENGQEVKFSSANKHTDFSEGQVVYIHWPLDEAAIILP